MSTESWRAQCKALLSLRKENESGLRVAVLGIGQELCGDDAAGAAAGRALAEKLKHREDVVAFDAGAAPENFTGALRRFHPGLVLLVDAAEMGLAAGEVRWLDWTEIDGVSAFTHSLPLSVLAGYLAAELDCQVALIGIQPAGDELDTPLSPAVRSAVAELVQELSELL